MNSKKFSRLLWVAVLSQMLVASSIFSAEEASPPVLGIVGLTPAEEFSCFAIWVPVSEELALNGIKWYNNDSAVVFPEFLVQSGGPEYPVSLREAVVVAENVSGPSGAWGEVVFYEPFASDNDGFYVILRVPEGVEVQGEGTGGGPAIGYTVAEHGLTGWMSAEGSDWVKLHGDYGYAVEPVFVDRESGMLVKSGPLGEDAPETVKVATCLHPAVPNPFNPSTTLTFSLQTAENVELKVFNLKGELVANLLNQHYTQGTHSVVWDGTSKEGRRLSSGVYFARLVAGNLSFSQRLVLVQ
jgi:hypothetical protein